MLYCDYDPLQQLSQMAKRKADEMQQAAEHKKKEQEEQNDAEQEPSSSEEDDSEYSDESGESDGSDDSAPEVSDEGEEDSPDEDPFDQIDVSFEFFDPKESDFHGLKALLHTYLDGQQYDNSQLVDTIIAQSAVGTVVRTGQDEDPIGVMTVLNTLQHQQQAFMSQIKNFMLARCKDTAVKENINKAWCGQGCGLVINERLINCPPQLAPPLVQALFDEIQWATEDMKEDQRDHFNFKQYIIMTRVYTDPLEQTAAAAAGKPPAGPSSSKQTKKQKGEQQQQQQQQQVLVYVRPEDEFFHQQCSDSFTFPVDNRAVGKDELQPLRLVMMVSADRIPKARAALDKVIGNAAAQQQ